MITDELKEIFCASYDIYMSSRENESDTLNVYIKKTNK